jgi:hypothetical protein
MRRFRDVCLAAVFAAVLAVVILMAVSAALA